MTSKVTDDDKEEATKPQQQPISRWLREKKKLPATALAGTVAPSQPPEFLWFHVGARYRPLDYSMKTETCKEFQAKFVNRLPSDGRVTELADLASYLLFIYPETLFTMGFIHEGPGKSIPDTDDDNNNNNNNDDSVQTVYGRSNGECPCGCLMFARYQLPVRLQTPEFMSNVVALLLSSTPLFPGAADIVIDYVYGIRITIQMQVWFKHLLRYEGKEQPIVEYGFGKPDSCHLQYFYKETFTIFLAANRNALPNEFIPSLTAGNVQDILERCRKCIDILSAPRDHDDGQEAPGN